MKESVTQSKLVLRYPDTGLTDRVKAAEYDKLRPVLKKLYNGSDPDLFLKFCATVFNSYAETYFDGRTHEEHYQKLRYFFDFFMLPLKPYRLGNAHSDGGLVKIEDPPESTQSKNGHKIAGTGIMLHTVEMPFAMENIGGYLNLTGHHVISAVYPVLTVVREAGKVVDILSSDEGGQKELFVYFTIGKLVNPKTVAKLEREITATLKTLFLTVGDFYAMSKEVKQLSAELSNSVADKTDGSETAEFLLWLIPSNFIFMGATEYAITARTRAVKVEENKLKRLGAFRDTRLMAIVFPGIAEEIKRRVALSCERPFMMVIDFLTHSTGIIYHKEPVDAVIIRQFDEKKRPVKAYVLFGRFSRGALTSRSADLPLLRKKFSRVIESEKIRRNSHMHREVFTAFNNLPKKELFYIDRQTLTALLTISFRFQSEDEIHLLIRHSKEYEYITAIVIIPAKKFSMETVEEVTVYMQDKLGKKVIFRQESQTAVAAHIFLYFPMKTREKLKIDVTAVAEELNERITGWDRRVLNNLVRAQGDQEGFALYNVILPLIPDLYREVVTPEEARDDFPFLRYASQSGDLQIRLTRTSATAASLRLFWTKKLNLMKLVPSFANFGLQVEDEIAIPFNTSGGAPLHVQLLRIEDEPSKISHLLEAKERLIHTIRLAIGNQIEDCSLNGLVLSAGLNWKQADFIRALQNYTVQINKTVNPATVTNTILKYPNLIRLLVEFFEQRFDPAAPDRERAGIKREEFLVGLDAITDLAEDNILRLLYAVTCAILRTNYFKKMEHHYLSIKIDCKAIPQMPRPVPMAEIFVHTPCLDGVHLRGGKVARGGLRWSDRPDDFRTEVLGLVKTQMVKNAVIVPSGSKGGFYIKHFRYTDEKDRMTVFKDLYQTFISGLLDLTDNLVGEEIVPPPNMVCYDGPDPYLVVAADKGTATMSDAANEISLKYGFWLKDAFASGGSIGYDHKKFGITARGAWESVKRHFRELGKDIQTEEFTVAGIGAMAGDVFGNGMLLSKKTKLVAAFNGWHIFFDPDPDTERSWQERKRLFENPHLKWSDYNPEIISHGGGVFNRSAKSIRLTSQMKERLGTQQNSMSGLELIRAILTMPIDLLYLGGIGTYVRSSDETNADVGDKLNDLVRVSAKELKAKVIGEGANLGFTQKARIEFSARGGLMNTDSLDNSAGVDLSDHEVNLKILLEQLLAAGELKDQKERNRFFVHLGPEVAEMVLQDNYLQSAGISLDARRSANRLEEFCDYIARMESKGVFSAEVENIPGKEALLAFGEKGGQLPRPILCVLFGYEKIRLSEAILVSNIVETAFALRYLNSYWPPVIRHDHEQYLAKHRLRKEIIATIISNKLVNQAGVAFVSKVENLTGAAPWEIVRAYLIAENLVQADEFRKMVHELDNKSSADLQYEMLARMEHLLGQLVHWMITHLDGDRISFDFVNQYRDVVTRFQENLFLKLETICSLDKGCIDREVEEYRTRNVPVELGRRLVLLPYLKDIMSILSIKEERHAEFIETGNLFILVATYFELDWVYEQLETYPVSDRWERRELENLAKELESHQRVVIGKVLDFRRKEETMEQAFNNYVAEKKEALDQYRRTTAMVKEEAQPSLTALSVLVRQLDNFA